MGKQERVLLPNGGVIKYDYDPLMRLMKVTDPEGRTTGYAYDESGNLIEMTDTLGNKYIREYDLLGRVTKETDPLGNETSYTYSRLGEIETITDAAGRVRRFKYTNAGKLYVIYFCGKIEQLLKYDNVGRVEARVFADGYKISYSYDVLSRVSKVEGSDGRTVEYEYDAMGRATKVVDGRSTTLYTYTPTGKLKSVVDALGNETAYTYDELDNLKRIHRAEGRISDNDKFAEEIKDAYEHKFPTVGKDGHVTIYSYNLAGQLTKVTDALGQEETYEYDQYGRLKTKTDRDNFDTTYEYNNLGAVTKVGYSDGRSVAFAYNELNQLNEINDWLGTTTIENDIRGRLTKVTDYQNRTVGYEYNSIGEKTKLTYPDGRQALYNYDEEGKLSSITSKGIDTGFDEHTSYAYDEIGRLIEKLLPNGVRQGYSYLPGGNLESMTSTDKEGILDKYFYSYNNTGLISGINRERRNLDAISGQYDYQYDEIGRLTRSSLNGELKASYEYDAFGNRTRLIERDAQTTYRYDALDRLVEARELNIDQISNDVLSFNQSQAIVKTYDYDKRGNQTNEYVDGLLNKTFTFDATNMLSKVVDSEKGELENQYNGLGFRVSSTRPEERIEYLCDLSRDCFNMLERTVNGETESFIYDRNVVSMSKAGNSYYYLQDELGSPMYMTGTDGAPVSSYAFDDFGRSIDPFTGKIKEAGNKQHTKHAYTTEGNIIQPFAFTGYQEDDISGLKFAQARFYNAKAGRFQSEDIIKGFKNAPYTLNHYGYCFGNPVGFSDKNGKLPGWMEDAWNEFCKECEYVYDSFVGVDVSLKDDTAFYDGSVVEMETVAHSGGDNVVFNYTSQDGKVPTFTGATFNYFTPAVYGDGVCFSLTLGTNFSDSKIEVTVGNTNEFVQGGSGKISVGTIVDIDGSNVAVISEVSYGETIEIEGFDGTFTITEKTTIKKNTKNWKDILDDAKKKVALGALIAALIFTVADLAPGDEEVTAAMVIEYINANYPELAQVLKQYPEILQRICQAAPVCAN